MPFYELYFFGLRLKNLGAVPCPESEWKQEGVGSMEERAESWELCGESGSKEGIFRQGMQRGSSIWD